MDVSEEGDQRDGDVCEKDDHEDGDDYEEADLRRLRRW